MIVSPFVSPPLAPSGPISIDDRDALYTYIDQFNQYKTLFELPSNKVAVAEVINRLPPIIQARL